MNTKTISTPDFMGSTAKIIAEVRASTCIDEIDVEVLAKILQDALKEYYDELDGYYEDEYYIAMCSARSKAYDDGHSDGYADGYDVGYDDGRSESHSDGYADGYDWLR